MSKKKVKQTKKVSKIKSSKKKVAKSPKTNKLIENNNLDQPIEKVYGEPQKVIPVKCSKECSQKCPKLIFKKDSFWNKIQRFFGYLP